MAIRCLIVDDNEQLLEAATASLSRDGVVVVGTARTSAEAIAETARLRPDVVLVDVGLADENGFDLAQQLVERFPYLASGVVMISTRPEEDLAEQIAESPAVGFIWKAELSVRTVRELAARKSGP